MTDTHLFLGASADRTRKRTGLVFGAGRVVTLGIFCLPPDLALLSQVQGEWVQPPSETTKPAELPWCHIQR